MVLLMKIVLLRFLIQSFSYTAIYSFIPRGSHKAIQVTSEEQVLSQALLSYNWYLGIVILKQGTPAPLTCNLEVSPAHCEHVQSAN